MNLDNLLDDRGFRSKKVKKVKQAALQDLSWLETGLVNPGHPNFTPTGEVGQKDNNIKPALEVEWGMGTVIPSFDEKNSGEVQRNLPAESQVDVGDVIVFARDQMNRGVMGKSLLASLKRKFTSDLLVKASHNGLRKQMDLEGIVGCIAVDGRGYKSCKAAMEACSHSPFKSHIKYVMGCECGTPHMLPSKTASMKEVSSSGNGFDDFMNSNDKAEVEKVAHCQSTMMPIMAGAGDLDESEMDQSLTELINVASLPASVARNIKAGQLSNIKKVQLAFKKLVAIQETNETYKYSSKIENAGFVIDTEDRPIDLVDVRDEKQISISEVPAPIEADSDVFKPQDVSLTQHLDPEFVGSGEFELDAMSESVSDLEVDPKGELDV
jgi:hypothetical protein